MDGLPLDTESMGAGDPGAAGALDLGAQAAPQAKPRISSPEEAAKLSPGTTFIGPDEKERVVPYKVTHPEQIADIPDGADFVGPDGKLRQKPKKMKREEMVGQVWWLSKVSMASNWLKWK